jgi:hypothetical protein
VGDTRAIKPLFFLVLSGRSRSQKLLLRCTKKERRDKPRQSVHPMGEDTGMGI